MAEAACKEVESGPFLNGGISKDKYNSKVFIL